MTTKWVCPYHTHSGLKTTVGKLYSYKLKKSNDFCYCISIENGVWEISKISAVLQSFW